MEETLQQTQQAKLQQRLNPQQVQFGRLLEMSTPEIEDEVRREIDENPALEILEAEDSSKFESDENSENDNFNETSDELQRADYSDDDMPDYGFGNRRQSADDTSSTNSFETFIASDEEDSMIAVLTRRLSDEQTLSEIDKKIAAHIIGNLDSNGYLSRGIYEIADDLAISEGLDIDPTQIQYILDLIRKLDPPGIGAIDLRDCLLLQLDRLQSNLSVKIAREIISENFDLFSKKHFDRIRSKLRIDKDVLQEALDLIKSLNPKPGSLLENSASGDRMRHIIPDFSVEYNDESDTFSVALLSRTPELGIESSFAATHSANERNRSNKQQLEAELFIRKKRDDATNFIKMLQMRANTLLSVMQAIVKYQQAFFISGDNSEIRPMILKDIAEITKLDLSVISRATMGKYVITPHGMYPLKLFFNERLKSDTDTSTHEILAIISDIIGHEDKQHPFSDESIKAQLMDKGFDIARRTIAKYREKLGIPVARLRKHF